MNDVSVTKTDVAKMIDHSLLRPELTLAQIREGCELARRYEVASVCLRPSELAIGGEILAGSSVSLGTVTGFPLGYEETAAKVAQTEAALASGAMEIDFVLNIGRLLSNDFTYVERDVAAVTETAHRGGAKVKVIFENCYLTDQLKIEACRICGAVGVDWVKTSTGFGTGGATLEDVRLMRRHSPAQVQIKAAGGVRSLETLLQYREAGCTRIGATATQAILDAVVS